MFGFRVLAYSLAFAICPLMAGPRAQGEKLKHYAQTPLRFEPNVGQADPSAPYVARGAGFRMILTGNQAVLAPDSGPPLRMSLAGARAPLAAKPQDRLLSISNYYFGNDPKKWHANVPNYGRLKFEQIYPGIDIVYYGTPQGLEYDLLVAPGADPSAIRWSYSGSDSIRLDSHGDLVFALDGHEIRQGKPAIYQQVAGRRRAIPGHYELANGGSLPGGEVRLALGDYDRTQTLVVDPPVLVYSTYLGGSGADAAAGIAVDTTGAVYLTGQTSGGFPTLDAYQSSAGNGAYSAFVASFSPTGALVYSTYLAGSAASYGFGIAVDSSQSAYVTGQTAGGGFPLMNATQATYGGGTYDAFIAKLTSSGGLVYSTYLGGSGFDSGSGIAVDSSGNAYIAGYTSSQGTLPTLDAAQGTYGGGAYDAFAAKLSAAGALSYSTYLGGSGTDVGRAITVDATGAAYVAGGTASTDFPTLNPLQPANTGGVSDAFVVKLSSAGAVEYATYLGGPNEDIAYGIAVDSSGAAYIAGATAGGFPTVNAAQPTYGGGAADAFVAKLSPAGSSLLYSTYLGGSGSDEAFAIALDPTGAAYITGPTTGSFPVQDALQPTYGGGSNDALIAELNPSGAVVYATYLGGSGEDYGNGIAVDSTGAAYVAGTAGAGFPTAGAYQSAFGGNADAFVAKIGPAATISTATITAIFPDTAVAGGAAFTLTINGSGFVSGAQISWNGTALTTTFVNAEYMTAAVPANLIASVGTALVTVTNAGQSASNAVAFNIVASPAVPTLTSAYTPFFQACTSGATEQEIRVAGSGFQSDVTFYWNGTSLGGIPNATGIYPNVAVPANLYQTPGSVTITASNGGAMSNGISFTLAPPITLTSLGPSYVAAGSGNVVLAATGTNFAAGYALSDLCNQGPINFGSLVPQLTGTTQLQITIPSASLTTPGTYNVFVAGAGIASNSLTFTVASAQSPGSIVEYPIPTSNAIPHGITAGPDGALWFAEEGLSGNRIGRITTLGAIAEFLVPTAAAGVEDITPGPGALWFSELNTGKIGRITTQGSITEFTLPSSAEPFGIVTGPDGNLWFADSGAGKIGTMTPTGAVTEFPIPTSGSQPVKIAVGPDCALWFTEAMGIKIGRITTTGAITEFPVPTGNGNPWGIVAGADGALWFTEPLAGKVGRITTAGTFTEFAVPTAGSSPQNVGIGSDGAVWFTEPGANQIGRVTTAGTVTEYPTPTSISHTESIVAGADGAMWFTEGQGNNIGRISTGLTATPALSILSSHSGAFSQGQPSASYTLTVSNAAGAGATTAPVSVTETLPSGLILSTMSGTGWSCTNNTCSRSDALSPGASYLAITVTVGVVGNAASPQVNTASVYGGGSALAIATDSTVISPAPALSIVSTHNNNFTQGQLGATYTITVSNAGSAPTSGTVTVTETLPSGLTFVSMSGTGWSCTANVCSRSDPLPGGASYNAITVTVNVAANAPSPQVNGVSISGGGSAPTNSVDYTNIDVPSGVGSVTEISLPASNSNPFNLTVGPDGALWFAEYGSGKIGRMTTAGSFSEFTPSTPDSGPWGIVTGSDGALWFTEYASGNIGRITTSGSITEYSVGMGSPIEITAGPDGALWFTIKFANDIGRITTSGAITIYPLPAGADGPCTIAVGPDGALWFSLSDSSQLGRITTAGSISLYAIPSGPSGPLGITGGPDGALWFAEGGGESIGRVTLAQAFSSYPLLSTGGYPYGIVVGPDNALWFAEEFAGNIGRITTSGSMVEYPIPTPGAQTSYLTVGPDGAIWFSESEVSKIGRMVTGFTSRPVLNIASSHSGSFIQGQQGAYTVTVINTSGAGVTNGAVTVMETVPSGMTLVSMAGAGWTCANGGNTCTRSDPLSGGGQYPAITVTTGVATNATSPQVNTVSVYGGGSALAAALDSTTVAPPLFTISCTPLTLSFTYTIGGIAPTGETCSVTATSSQLSIGASASTTSGGTWLFASPASGGTPETLTVSVNTLGLAAGTYNGAVQVSGGGQVFSVPVTLTVNLSSQVTFALTPASVNVAAAASTGTTSLTLIPAGSNTAWTAASTATWLHITSPTSGSGAATFGYSVDLNTGPARSGSLNVSSGGDVVATLTVNQAASSCAELTVSPTSFTFGSGGGTGVLTFTIPGCPWTASATDSTLITGLPASGSTATVTFGVAAGATAETAFINVGTTPPTSITVTRSAPICTYTIATPGAIGSSQGFPAAGGTGAVNVTAPAGCSWTASSNSSFVTVTGGASGSGSGSVSYSVGSNPALAGSPTRTGTLTVAGLTYNISQDPQGPQSYTCVVTTGVSPILRPEGIAEPAGDILVNCTGYSLGGITGDVLVMLNTSLTNHTLNSDPSGQTSDALLLVDDPPAASLTLTGAGQNVYRGTIAGPLAVIFKNVSLAPLTGSFSHVFRITNVRVDASHLSSGSATGTVSIASSAPFTVAGATQTIGFSLGGSSTFNVGSSSVAALGQALPVTFAENFATAFRIKVASGQDPSTAGTVYNSESGYVNSAVLGADTGFATNGTRLVARFANIPSGTAIYAPVTQTSGTATAQLMSADNNGTGGSPLAGSAQVPGYQPVALVNGAGTATWEITASNPNALDTLTFSLLLSNPTLSLVNSCAGGAVPSICGGLAPQVAVSAPSNTAPVPRFVNPTAPASSQLTMLSIAPNAASAQSLSTSAKLAAMRPMELPARHAAAAVPTTVTGNTIMVGGTVTIGELLQSNTTSALANGACVGTTLPPSYTITACAADNGGTCSPTGSNSVSTCYPSIDPGQLSNITVIADTTMTGSAQLAANVTSDSGNFAANGAGAFAETVTPAPGPSVALSLSGSPAQYVPAGQPIAYNLSVNNSGAGPTLAGDPITVGISLPNLTGISIAAPSWNCIQTGFSVACTYLGAVPNPGVVGFSVTGTVPLSTTVGANIAASATLTFGGQLALPPAVTTGVIAPPPSAPTLSSPTNGAVVSTPVTLTWSQATGATSYAVYLGTANPPSQAAPSTALTTYSAVGLTVGTKYYWYIVAINSSGSTNSAISSFTVAVPCQFTLAGSAASLPSAGTATTSAAFPGGVYPENPLTVGITPTGGTCTTYSATSSASWLSATFSGNSFAYTALSNAHLSKSQSATLTIANANGGSQTFTVTEAPDTAEPLMSTRQVRALYESMLGRDPDPGGFTFWTGNGAAGLGQMGDNFLTSPEAFNSDFAVMAAYQAATGGPPTYAQFLTAAAGVRTGTQPVAQLFNSLIAANSSYSATTLYQNLLNRAPTSGASGESAACTAATLATCFEILIGFPSSFTPVITPNNEFQSTCGATACIGIDGITHGATGDHTNTLYVTMLYFVILDRDTDPSGLQFWIGIANMGGPGLQFQGSPGYFYRNQILGPGTPGQGFIGSPEFQGLFQ